MISPALTLTDSILRTPDNCFHHLPDFSYKPHYWHYQEGATTYRIAYIDEGPKEAPVIVCLHGEPTWSFLYRKMLPLFLAKGYRVIAPDLLGFGRSDKPTDPSFYTFERHRVILICFLLSQNFSDITLVCHDWGGVLGLTLPMILGDKCQQLVVMNTALTTGDFDLSQGFFAWREYCRQQEDLDVGGLMKRAVPHLSPSEEAAYNAPFPDKTYKVGVKQFPEIVPVEYDDPGAAISRQARDYLKNWSGQAEMIIGVNDPIFKVKDMMALAHTIKGCRDPQLIGPAGHFVPEWADRLELV